MTAAKGDGERQGACPAAPSVETTAASATSDAVPAPAAAELVVTPAGGERIDGILVGTIVLRDGEDVWVDYPENRCGRALRARAAALPASALAGAKVALSFEAGDGARPFVLGLMARREDAQASLVRAEGTRVVELDTDLEIRCGAASVTLTQDGKIMLRGEYVLSLATGTNRILGGAVRIN